MKKKLLGQFYTTNVDYILSSFESYVKDKIVCDPFAGAGDLLNWAERHGAKSVCGYDIDIANVKNNISHNDSLLNPHAYKFSLSNPPYLNVNKANLELKQKYFKQSEFEDLYLISIESMLNSEEGILIIPLNFLSAENSLKLRRKFLDKFDILKVNYFQSRVFEDTSINVIALYYKLKSDINRKVLKIPVNFFPSNEDIFIEIEEKYDWQIGGAILSKIQNQKNELKISRLTERHIQKENFADKVKAKFAYVHVSDIRDFEVSQTILNKISNNIIMLKAIDSGSELGKIALEDIRKYGVVGLIGKDTSRHQIQLIFGRQISTSTQERLIEEFNKRFNEMRKSLFSLFLTNYRDNDRKRVSFDFVYQYLNLLVKELDLM